MNFYHDRFLHRLRYLQTVAEKFDMGCQIDKRWAGTSTFLLFVTR